MKVTSPLMKSASGQPDRTRPVKIEELLVAEGIMEEGESLYSPSNIMLMHHVTAALRARAVHPRR
ncbi:hypothetical protein EIN43_13185 [Enterobacter hormaechei]|uniref:Uncharacterized protein n=1 Tax=Enterobacter hormaechei TaxID=158836 RepID=A0A4Y5ZP14_9ENTR|nr:hypothetical protein EIN43_13185 [Enterobacter hormaechei]